jgi:hypothetical protein
MAATDPGGYDFLSDAASADSTTPAALVADIQFGSRSLAEPLRRTFDATITRMEPHVPSKTNVAVISSVGTLTMSMAVKLMAMRSTTP